MEIEQISEEIWKPIPYNPNYLVSNLGRIRTLEHSFWNKHNGSYSVRKGCIKTLTKRNKKGYLSVNLSHPDRCKRDHKDGIRSKVFSVHQLVAQAFIPNPLNLPQINHIDGDKTNNKVSNLEWCTNEYNMQHSYKTGLREQCKKRQSLNCHLRKLTIDDVLYIRHEYMIRDLSKKGCKQAFCNEMALRFNLKSPNTIRFVVMNQTNRYTD